MHVTKLIGVAALALLTTTAFAQDRQRGSNAASGSSGVGASSGAAAPSAGGMSRPATTGAANGGAATMGPGPSGATNAPAMNGARRANVSRNSQGYVRNGNQDYMRSAAAGNPEGRVWRHRRGGWGGFWPGLALGAGAGYGYYGYPSAYGYPADYGDAYAYDDDDAYGSYAAADDSDDDSYCAQRYRSYDPASGTYLGYDGQRHPCP